MRPRRGRGGIVRAARRRAPSATPQCGPDRAPNSAVDAPWECPRAGIRLSPIVPRSGRRGTAFFCEIPRVWHSSPRLAIIPVTYPPLPAHRLDRPPSMSTNLRRLVALALPLIALPGAGRGLGADEKHWAFFPPGDPRVPTVRDQGWPTTPIDHFILAGLESRDLRPAPPADKRNLIRRTTFDLTGLPPTPDEIDDFLSDRSPDAFAKVVDRLLASPVYGERWGRHWLDVARYADSNGLDENIAHGNAWRYRDYVVAAFNADKPYE